MPPSHMSPHPSSCQALPHIFLKLRKYHYLCIHKPPSRCPHKYSVFFLFIIPQPLPNLSYPYPNSPFLPFTSLFFFLLLPRQPVPTPLQISPRLMETETRPQGHSLHTSPAPSPPCCPPAPHPSQPPTHPPSAGFRLCQSLHPQGHIRPLSAVLSGPPTPPSW